MVLAINIPNLPAGAKTSRCTLWLLRFLEVLDGGVSGGSCIGSDLDLPLIRTGFERAERFELEILLLFDRRWDFFEEVFLTGLDGGG